MARGIVVPFTLDPREWTRGLKVIETDMAGLDSALEDVGAAADTAGSDLEGAFTDAAADLKAVGDAADTAGRDLEDAFTAAETDLKGVGDAADTAGQDLQDAFRGVGDLAERELREAERAADRAGSDIGDNIGGGAATGIKGKLKGAGSEVGAEFAENFGESVRGGDLAGGVLETVTSLGPALGLAGLGIAAGAGIVNGIIQGANEKAEALRQTIKGLMSTTFDTLVAEGHLTGASMVKAIEQGMIDQQTRSDLLTQVLGVENVVDAYAEINRLTEETGLKQGVISDALTGNTAALEIINERIETQQGKYDEIGTQLGTNTAAAHGQLTPLGKQRTLVGAQLELLRDVAAKAGAQRDATRQAASAADDYNRDLANSVDPADRLASRFEGMVPPSLSGFESSIANAAQHAANIRADIDAIPNEKTVIIRERIQAARERA